jgi:hypothetical protein
MYTLCAITGTLVDDFMLWMQFRIELDLFFQ